MKKHTGFRRSAYKVKPRINYEAYGNEGYLFFQVEKVCSNTLNIWINPKGQYYGKSSQWTIATQPINLVWKKAH